MATSTQVLEYQLSDMSYVKTIFDERSTCVAYQNDTTYIGTIKGLYVQIRNDSVRYLGDVHPLLRERISKVVFGSDGQVWVATYDYGLVALRHLKVVQTLNLQQGLSSNFCRTMFMDGHYLWVGTAQGLNRVDLRTKKPKINHYTNSTGLISNIINDILVRDGMVYVATPEGIS